jgi:diguanylate cyclase (GGDEF)-like protein
MVDVNGLKTVNDTFGHPVADQVLQAIGAALRLHVRAEDLVYRLGGDEFAALSSSRDPDALERRLGQYIEAEVPEAGRQRASVGVARVRPGDEPLTITSRADAALYKVKGQRVREPAVPISPDAPTPEPTGSVG